MNDLKENYYKCYALSNRKRNKRKWHESCRLCISLFEEKYGVVGTILASYETIMNFDSEILSKHRTRVKNVIPENQLWICDREE